MGRFESADGHKANSKFRMKRYDDAHEGVSGAVKAPGPRAQRNAQEATPQEHEAVPAMQGQGNPGPDGPTQMSQVAAEHGPAIAVHTAHDHENGLHHTHSVHADGYEHHQDHASAMDAHEAAKGAAGVQDSDPMGTPDPEQMGGETEPEVDDDPKKKKSKPDADEDDYEAEPLD